MSKGAVSMARAVNLRSITSLRFFAALLVVLHHAFGPEGIPVLNLGFLGVTFFFVLSGFILTWADSARHGVVAFYQNRIARIFPLHLATLGIAVLLPFGLTDSPATLIQNLTLTQAWSNDGAHSFNWVSWSISVEAFFYLLFPFAFVALRNRSMKALLLVAAIAILVQLGFSEWIRTTDLSNAHFLTYDFPPYRLGEFIVGICLGHALLGGWRMSPR
ncbi:MAG: acyltransferase 3, partial [Cryobacterium sp.]|nr:acyltransferase 3 [Cryobacterium sp.]